MMCLRQSGAGNLRQHAGVFVGWSICGLEYLWVGVYLDGVFVEGVFVVGGFVEGGFVDDVPYLWVGVFLRGYRLSLVRLKRAATTTVYYIVMIRHCSTLLARL